LSRYNHSELCWQHEPRHEYLSAVRGRRPAEVETKLERLARLMSDLLGLAISEGALVNILDDSRPAFARQTSLIRARLLGGSILQSDETSVRVGKRNWWTWVFHHGDDCCFVIRPSRGKDVVAEFLGDVRPAPAKNVLAAWSSVSRIDPDLVTP
jgi:hypothetical protein